MDLSKSRATGLKVIIEKLEKQCEKKHGDIIIPDSHNKGAELCKGKILSLGAEAKKEGICEGDIILYDYYSVFSDSHPYVITNVENIIMKEV